MMFYLPKAPPILATVLRDIGFFREAVELLQVINCKLPLNGEICSQIQSCDILNIHHLRKEKQNLGKLGDLGHLVILGYGASMRVCKSEWE